jgi:integrase
LRGRPVARRDLTFSELVDVFLERHAIVAKPRTITELRWRLKQSEKKFGDIPLAELEGMADEIAGYAVTLTERLRYPLMAAFRQALEAGMRYGYMTGNPAKLAGPNPMPAPREIRVYTPDELKAIVAELGPLEAAAVRFAAATGLRPAEWAAVERRDVDKARRIVFVRGTKTHKSRREVPLTSEALAALDSVPPRIDSRYVFTTTRKCPGRNEPGPFDVANFRRRVGAGDRLRGDREAREDLRPTFDVHLERTRERAHGVRDGESRRDEREDNRGALRSPARHGPRVDARASRGFGELTFVARKWHGDVGNVSG